jgi:hypothetical protein
MNLGAPFPPDLPDLLRLACRQGKMRLNVWFGARENGRGHQANLANSGDGWTVDYDADPLEAITKVLRVRYGKMLERERVGQDSDHTVHPAHDDTLGRCHAAPATEPQQIDIEEAIAAAAAEMPLGPECFFCGRGKCEPGCPSLPDPIHPDFAEAVAKVGTDTSDDDDLLGLIG